MTKHRAFFLAIMSASLVVYGQDPQPAGGGWRKFSSGPAEAPPPQGGGQVSDAAASVPPVLNLAAGTMVTVRVDQLLSSNNNRPGDTFTASLVQPLVVNGLVVARRGQTIAGRVADVDKGGRVKGTSRLGLELVELSLVDGQQVPLRTELMQYNSGTSNGRDATAIGTTTGIGAAIGAAAAGGAGAGIGAGAGAAASVIGVLITRGHPTEVYPESVLTFRIVDPIAIQTDRSAQAFVPVRQGDYATQTADRQPRLAQRAPAYFGGGGYGPGWYGPGYGPGWYGPGWYGGTGIIIRTGPRFYGGRRGRR